MAHQKSKLVIVLRIIGVLNILVGIIVGAKTCTSDGIFASRYSDNQGGLFLFILLGIIGCIVFFALAKCVEAASMFLNSHKYNEEKKGNDKCNYDKGTLAAIFSKERLKR